MTQQLLFLAVILIGAYYANKNGKKAKSNIERIQKKKEEDALLSQQDYLEKHIFYGLKNRNMGFDVETIHYFSEDDFAIVLQRIENLNLGINGIEPWSMGEFYDVVTFEDFESDPFDAGWYHKAFDKFRKENADLLYAATYEVPDNLL